MASRHNSNQSFSGSLQVKKKAELQEIAQALSISDSGTRDELQTRIKKHMDENERDLEDNPTFAGLLLSRRRGRSLQPQSSGRAGDDQSFETGSHGGRHGRTSLASVAEQAEYDLRDVSMMLPRTARYSNSPASSRAGSEKPSPNELLTSPERGLLADALAQPEVQAAVEMERNVVRSSARLITQTRQTLSNATTIYMLTAMLDLVVMALTVHYANLPASNAQSTMQTLSLAATQWAIPSAVIPTVCGYLISFHSSGSVWSFDSLSASIIRFACNVVYPFAFIRVSEAEAVRNLDVLGLQWRLTTAGAAVAFGFAEAISRSSNKSTSTAVTRQQMPNPTSSADVSDT